jgi:hypothetical protein
MMHTVYDVADTRRADRSPLSHILKGLRHVRVQERSFIRYIGKTRRNRSRVSNGVELEQLNFFKIEN